MSLLKASLAIFITSGIAMPGAVAIAQTLQKATKDGDIFKIQSLIAAGTPLDIQDSAGRTALLDAVENDETEIALALIAAGANINAQAANRDTPWLLAGATGRTEITRAMIPKGPDFRIRNRYGGNALIPACERGHVDTVKLLLTTGIDVNHVNDLGWTCLLEAVILGDGGARQLEIIRLVLEAGADPNIADKEGISPLAHARARGQVAIADTIEKSGGK